MLKVASTLFVTLIASIALAKPYDPQVLIAVEARVVEVFAQGETPVVLFDIDDTVMRTRDRHLRILREFATTPEVLAAYPAEAKLIHSLMPGRIKYLVEDTLMSNGIADPTLIKMAVEFWGQRFFTDEYVQSDRPVSGASKYLRRLVKAGAKIVYLTGRDAPRMEKGTRASLTDNRFPISEQKAALFMKPDKKADDLQFKKDTFTAIARMGEVVGVFENEPANLNAMAETFPEALPVFVDTVHSPKPDVPLDAATWIGDYR